MPFRRIVALPSFNSRARVGATRKGPAPCHVHAMFQFTRPGGRDEMSRSEMSRAIRFNSRARVGATSAYRS